MSDFDPKTNMALFYLHGVISDLVEKTRARTIETWGVEDEVDEGETHNATKQGIMEAAARVYEEDAVHIRVKPITLVCIAQEPDPRPGDAGDVLNDWIYPKGWAKWSPPDLVVHGPFGSDAANGRL